MSRRIVPIPTDRRTFASAAPELDELLSFCRDSFVNGLFGPLTGQADLRVGGLQGSDSVSSRNPPLKPLPDPIPLKIEFPTSNGRLQRLGLFSALIAEVRATSQPP